MAEQQKIERKYYAHFIDAAFGGATPNYVRLGKDLEEYNEELNPDVEVKKNILGEQSVQHNGYEVQSEVDTFYAYLGDPLCEQLSDIANPCIAMRPLACPTPVRTARSTAVSMVSVWPEG